MCEYHSKINDKLNIFIEKNKIPNILFHGPSGSGKKTILNKVVLLAIIGFEFIIL